jgi:hypothetical protein
MGNFNPPTGGPAAAVMLVNPITGDPQASTGGVSQGELIAALKSGTATKTATAANTSQVTVLAANANRKGATIANTDDNILYVDTVTGVTATDFMYALSKNQTVEIPAGYTGAIYGVWATAGSGGARARELS